MDKYPGESDYINPKSGIRGHVSAPTASKIATTGREMVDWVLGATAKDAAPGLSADEQAMLQQAMAGVTPIKRNPVARRTVVAQDRKTVDTNEVYRQLFRKPVQPRIEDE
jgi:hypothetical protein